MGVGSYSGKDSDNRNITTVGFSPEYLIIKSSSSYRAVHRSDKIIGDATLEFLANANFSNGIQSLLATGFQVGSSSIVNDEEASYFWIAFAASQVLPVQISTFTVQGVGATSADLRWTTLSEVNN
jgi:hypothetical protein